MTRVRHPLARVLAAGAARLLPPAQHEWGLAMRHELAAIADGGPALRFALGCLGHALLVRMAWSPLWLGAGCAAMATALGMVFMAIGGAPPRFLLINGAALAIGLLGLANLRLLQRLGPLAGGNAALLLAAVLAVLTRFGTAAQGAVRWVQIGGATIQPSLILIPLLAVLAARSRSATAALAVAIAALTLALQPDRAMAGALVLAALGTAWIRPGGAQAGSALVAVTAFVAAMARPDLGQRMPYVDQILWLAFGVHPLAGLAVWTGAGLLIAPAALLWRARRDLRAGLAAHGLVWSGVIGAAALGNYPTPLVGFGSSAVIGYCLSLLALTPPGSARAPAGRPGSDWARDPGAPPGLEMALR